MFSGALLEKCRFSACAFDFSRLNDVLARGCSFENCTFSGASLFVTAFENCRVSGCSFAGRRPHRLGRARRHTRILCARSLSAQKAGLFRHQSARYELCGSGPRKSRSFRLRPYGDRVPQCAAERMRLAPCQIFAHRYPLCKNAENKDRFGGRRCISQDCSVPSSTKKPAKSFVKKRVLFCQPPYGVHRAYKRV